MTYFLNSEINLTHKLSPSGSKEIFIGYFNDYSTFKFYLLSSKTTVLTKNANFIENDFPGLKKSNQFNFTDNLFSSNELFSPEIHENSKESSQSNTDLISQNETNELITSNELTLPLTTSTQLEHDKIITKNILNYNRRGQPIINTTY